MTLAQVQCECGRPTTLEVPEDLGPHFRESLIRMGAECDQCRAKKRDEQNSKTRLDAVEKFRRRAGESDIPKTLRNVRFEGLDSDPGNRDAIAAARSWGARGRMGLVLTGDVGVGKTTIAAAASWMQLVHGKLRWTSMPRVFALLGNGKDGSAQRTAADLQMGSGALVLDDLDKARPSAYGASVVFGLIDHRMTEGEPLLITMNLTYGQLAEHFPEPYGDAIASRLVGYCGEAITVRGRDRRTPAPPVLPGVEETA